jgi:bla regulator protein BlaR1
MQALLAIALKSVLISGLTLVLLAVFRRRSSAERSWVAHIGLLALVTLAFAPLVMPTWAVETPALFANTQAPAIQATAVSQALPTVTAGPQAAAPVQSAAPTISTAAIASVA